jgi:hypothetical protein
MSSFARRPLTPLAAVTAAAFLFALLLVLVRLQWGPLEPADHGTAARLNSLVAGHAMVVSAVKAVTWLAAGACCGHSSGWPSSRWPSGAGGGWRSTCWSLPRAN